MGFEKGTRQDLWQERGYGQTYGIDYDETFAPVEKMSTVRTLISCATNLDWPLHQLDVLFSAPKIILTHTSNKYSLIN